MGQYPPVKRHWFKVFRLSFRLSTKKIAIVVVTVKGTRKYKPGS